MIYISTYTGYIYIDIYTSILKGIIHCLLNYCKAEQGRLCVSSLYYISTVLKLCVAKISELIEVFTYKKKWKKRTIIMCVV